MQRSTRISRACVALIALLLSVQTFADPHAFGQQAMTSATLTGRIEDGNGASVGGATVTAISLDTNRQRVVITDEQGRYRFPSLPVGPYRISVAVDGFAAANRQVILTVGQTLDMPVELTLVGVSAHVNVTSDAPLIETVRTQVSETVLPQEIDNLPLNGRNYLDLALLVPGVSRTNLGSNQRFAETSAVPGTGISIAGQRNLNNSFVVDGMSANDDAADLSGTFYSEEVIREFQAITSGGVAEFGRASSGVVNIITRSGTNDWQGTFYGFFRNQRLDARNSLAPTKDPLTQGQYGASIAGPIKRNETFLFSNFEQTRRNDSNVITISPANVGLINNLLTSTSYPGLPIETGIVPGGYDSTNLFVRVDHNLNSSNLLNARYSLYNIAAANSRSVGGLNSVSRGTALNDRDQTLAVNYIPTISTRTVNEARFQFTRSRLRAPVNDATGPAVNIAGVANFGTATVSPLGRDIDLFELVNNTSTQIGTHSVKAGVDFLLNRVNILFPGAVQGVYTFSSLSNFVRGTYSSFQQAFGAPGQFQSNPNIGFFVQDEWRPCGDLTINAGVRYDAQFLPSPIHTDTNNYSPRIGLAYSPRDHKTVVRASFGIYFDRIPLRATSNALQRDGSKYIVVQLAPGQSGAPVFPSVLPLQPTSLPIKPNITRIDPNIKNSYSEQASFQIEHEAPGHSSISIGYMHLRGLHLILSRNVNVPLFPASAGISNLGRPDSNFGNISRSESSGDSYYDGMVVSFNKPVGSWARVRVSYTLSKGIDDAGNFFFSSPQDNFNLRDDRGLSDNDQRHRFVLSGSFEAPDKGSSHLLNVLAGFQLNYIFNYASRLPFNVMLGSDRNFDTNSNDRPVGVGRNTGHGFDYASLDIRVSRRFRFTDRVTLEAIAEGFNLLNRSNFAVPNNTFGSGVTPLAAFGQPTAAFDPRQIQLGLKLRF